MIQLLNKKLGLNGIFAMTILYFGQNFVLLQ